MKIDKTVFGMYKKVEKPNVFKYWQTKTVKERLLAVAYLNSVAFNYDINNPPKVDRTVFSIEKREKRIINDLKWQNNLQQDLLISMI